MRLTIFAICLFLMTAMPVAAAENAVDWDRSLIDQTLEWFLGVFNELGGAIVSSGLDDGDDPTGDDEIGGGIVSSGLTDDDDQDTDEIGGGIVSSGLQQTGPRGTGRS